MDNQTTVDQSTANQTVTNQSKETKIYKPTRPETTPYEPKTVTVDTKRLTINSSNIVGATNKASNQAKVDKTELKTDPKGQSSEPKQEDKSDSNPGSKTEANTERPSWLPEKFKSAEDLVKAYNELEQKQSGKTDKSDGKAGDPKSNKTSDKSSADFSSYYSEVQSNGSLSEDSYKKLEAIGYPKDIVDRVIEGEKAILTTRLNSVYDSVGGRQQFDAMMEWANNNLSDDELSTYNDMINVPDNKKMIAALKGLNARYQSGSKEFKPVQGKFSQQPDIYQTKADWLNDIRSPKYKDKDFKKYVEEKAFRSFNK